MSVLIVFVVLVSLFYIGECVLYRIKPKDIWQSVLSGWRSRK